MRKSFLYYVLTVLVALALITSCQSTKQEQKISASNDYLDWPSIANKLIAQSDLKTGEKVLLVGKPGRFDPLIPLLKEGVEQAGAVYLGAVSITADQPEEWKTEFSEFASKMGLEELPFYLSSVDLGIMLPGATPADKVYAGMQEVLKQGKGRTIHFHWAGAYDLNGILFEPDSAVDVFYQDVLLNTDYEALAAKQKEFETAMRDQWITVTTPAGTHIKFKIGDRQVTKQDGNVSLAHTKAAHVLIDREVELPSGAIRVAPIEETVEGTIAFPDSDWGGKRVKGLMMTFKGGKVINVEANENLEAVQEELKKAGDAGKAFREFALGFNPKLAIPDDQPWIPYYGYGAGVVRLSLGDNSELGGKVGGGYVRWNFFTDATVKVGEDTWVENGNLIK